MSQRDAFVSSRRERWQRLDAVLATRFLRDPSAWAELATLYRGVCADLARAQALGLEDDVVRHLDGLAARAHNRLYSGRRSSLGAIARDVAIGFPAEVWRSWRFFLAACLLFYGPFAVGAIGAFGVEGFAPSVLPESALGQMEAMYSDSIGRTSGQDATMAGFYVWNNVGIAFRCFATGALAGLGTVFYLVYNGLVMGTIFGHLFGVGLGWNLIDFTAGHTAWELTGVVVAGAAGLKLGWAIVVTGGRTRVGSIRRAGPGIYRLILGAMALLLVAAAVEGFWSAGPQPLVLKLAFGALSALLVGAWLLVGGWVREP